MWHAALTDAPIGARLAFSAFAPRNAVLAPPGSALTPALRARLLGAGYHELVLLDADEPVPPLVTDCWRQAALLRALQEAQELILEALVESPHATAARAQAAAAELTRTLQIATENLTHVAGLAMPGHVRGDPRLRWLDESVDAAFAAVFVAARVGIAPAQVQALGHGMLLRDVALLVSPVYASRHRLSAADRAAIQSHGDHAAAALDRLGWPNATARRIVRCHHEQRAAAPRAPRAAPPDDAEPSSAEHARLTAIASVCDTFVALNADRPYRDRFRPEAVREALADLRRQPASAETARVLLDYWIPPNQVSYRRTG